MSGFDIDGLKREQIYGEITRSETVQQAEELLRAFIPAAQEIKTPLRTVPADSNAVQATGIAIASWPKTEEGEYHYYPLLTSNAFDSFWLAAESQGLSVIPSGQFYLKGDPVSSEDAAHWLAELAKWDPTAIRNALTNALKGHPMSFG